MKFLTVSGLSKYSKFIDHKLTLSEQLAAASSILSNEQTLLSYQRTAITIFLTGVSFIKFFVELWAQIFGICLIVCALITAFIGFISYFRMRNLIINLEIKVENQEKANDKIKLGEN